MDTSKGGSKNSAGFDPLDEDPLGAIDDNVVLSSNGNGDTVDIKPNFIDDFESQIDSLVVNVPPAVKIESPAPESISVKTKGKRTYKKKRSKVNADSEDSSDDEEVELESKRFKKETSSNNSLNSNEDSDAALSSTRSRRSSRKSRPNNFYTKNYELESGSGSDNDKKSKGKKTFDEEEYTPVKEKKVKTPKSNAGRKKKNLEDSLAEIPAAATSETVINFSNETPFGDDLAVLIPTSTDVPANDLGLTTITNDVTNVIHDVSFGDLDVSITGQIANDKADAPNKSEAPQTNALSVLKKSGLSVRPVEVGSNLTEIKIASVSSMADMTPNSSKNNPLSNMFKETQSRGACSFIKDALTTTAELGNLLNSKANEFVEKKATDSFMTDTRKLQFCMEKAFVLFNLARNNLSGIEKKLKGEYTDFMIKNKYDRLLKCDKNTNAFLSKYDMTLDALEMKSCPELVDSDSDCEIVEVASAPSPTRPSPMGRGRHRNKQQPAELDILRRVEKNGISWKAKKSAGGGGGSVSSDGEGVQKVQLPGKNPVWINKSICVKKVTPAKNSNRSFFREDGRTLKPPDPPATLPFTRSGEPAALSATRLVGKTALVRCWLDLAHHQTNNFFSTLKRIEKPKRHDSCSDLGDSCSDDEDVPAVVSEDFLTAISEDFLTVCRNDSLLKLCINRINSIFLARNQKLLDKFDFHLFDDLPEPNDYSEDDEEVIQTIISTTKDIINTFKTNALNKLSKEGINDDPFSDNLPATSKETLETNKPKVGSCKAPTNPEIRTGNRLSHTNKSLGTITASEKEIDATTQLPSIDAVSDISDHLPPFEESIITNALCSPLTPEHKISDASNQFSEQEITNASDNLANIEETITSASINLPTTEQAITDACINLPTTEQAITDACINLPTTEQAITDACINLPTAEQVITDACINLPTTEQAITDACGNLPTTEQAITDACINLPTVEQVITDACINLLTTEQAIIDAFINLPTTEQAITDACINLPTTEQAITDACINLPTTEQAITDACINLPTTEQAITHASINLPTTEQAITDASINLSTTEQAISDACINLPTTEQAITHASINLSTTEQAITDACINLPTTKKAIINASINLPTTEQAITDASINLSTTEQAISDACINLPTTEQAITHASINLLTTEQAINDASINLPIGEQKITDNFVDLLTANQVNNLLSPTHSSLDASIDSEKDAFLHKKSTANVTEKDANFPKTAVRSADAFKYLLQSSSNSDSSTSVRTQRKKKYTRRIKRISFSHKSSDENGSLSELFKVTDSSDSDKTDEEYSKYKNDPKFYYKTTVNVIPLSSRQLQPFQKYLQELAKDLEIEKLVDFSTLIRHKRQESQREEPKAKTTDVIKKKKAPEELLPEKNLLNLLTSDVPIEDTLDNTLLEMEQKEMTVKKPEELIEDLAHKFQLKNNSMAKNFLVDSSSSSDTDMSIKQSPKTDQQEFLLLQSSGSSENIPKKSDLEEDADQHGDVEIELKTPVKKSIQKSVVHKPADDLLSEIDNLLRDAEGKKKKKKQPSALEEEQSLWLKKRDKILSSEKKKLMKSGSDKDSEDSDGSFGSADSQIPQTPGSPHSRLNPSDISVDPSSEQSTPITPKTKNILAQSDLLSDSSDANSESSDDTLSSSTQSVKEDNETPSRVEVETPSKGRKNIRKVIRDDSLMDTTILAAKEEEERMRRLNEKHSQLTELISLLSPKKAESVGGSSLVLDFDIESKTPLVTVHPALVKILKPHQIDGVKFMWDTCFESVQMVCDGKAGAGCILAHCMGLGKSLQVVALVHSVLNCALLSTRTVLICCPLSTVLNWADEFNKWLRKTGAPNSVKVFELSKFKKNYERGFHLEDWHKTGGVFIIGYEMFRLLTTMKESPEVKSHVINKIYTTLLNPGPDLIVCDEGHLLKNDNTALAKVMNKIHTRRRIVLTGTPLQNNLKEYYCMVNFVKPNLLGSRREYFNRFENPISNGQHRDSSTYDISIMKKRSHVLHKMLEGSVQRKEATILYKYLPRKLEYVLLTTLSKCQVDIYQHYLEKYAQSHSSKGTSLLKDFHILQKIWTHPRTLQQFLLKSRQRKLNSEKVKTKKSYVKRMLASDGFVCLEDDGVIEEETLASPDDSDWWMSYVDKEALENLETSPKFSVAFKLLDESLQAGDKMLIFCTSLFTLDALEYFLKKDKGWKIGHHYYRLDGSVSLENRQNWCRQFNSERNKAVKLFLISTRAGGLGINMIAANRVIIMDVSWNPSHDMQSIFRVYRFGQKKDCFIYRLVSLGTMEEKIYERSVTKQAVSCRVVDEQQVDRHYNMAELSELYFFNPIPNGPQPIPSFPSDHVLATVLATTRLESKKRHSENFVTNNPINCDNNTKMSEDDNLAPNNPTKTLDKSEPSTGEKTSTGDNQVTKNTEKVSSSIIMLTNKNITGDNQVTKNTEKMSSSIIMLPNRSASDSQVTISNSPEKISSSIVMLTNRSASDSQVTISNSPEKISSSILMLTNRSASDSQVTISNSPEKISSSILMLTNRSASDSQVTISNSPEKISSSILMLTNRSASDSQVTISNSPEKISSSITMLKNRASSDNQTTENTEKISSSIVMLANRPADNDQATENTERLSSSILTLGNKPTSGKGKVTAGGDGSCLPYVWSMHEHDSLLKDLHEEQLDEDDRKLAWLEYEAEREQQRVVKANNGEMIVPDLKMPKKKYKIPPFGGFKDVFPVSTIMPNRMIPISNHHELTNHVGGSILPDSGSDNVFKPRPSFKNPSFNNPSFGYARINSGSSHTINSSVRQPYVVGRYGPLEPPNQMRPTMMADMAFQNIQISNIRSATSSHSANAARKKRNRKVPQYFPTDKASTSSPVMDLTSLPDTPDKDKPPGRRRSASGKKSAKRTPGKTPKKATPRRLSGVKKSSPKNLKHNSTKKLDFGEDPDCRISSGEANIRYHRNSQESILLEQSKESTPVFTIDLLD